MKQNNNKAKKFLERAEIYIRSNEEMPQEKRDKKPLKTDVEMAKIMSNWLCFVSTYDILDNELKYHNLTREELRKEFPR